MVVELSTETLVVATVGLLVSVDVVVVGMSSTTCRTRLPRNATSQVAVR
jgi:hypothetical protein